ncbi:TetR/AcrR family transcriptional regulator [Saccharothrix longispora]|uniref:AcrR family transcriptional regulator n=1 Tax=Saccharothrix longispora TaxID=33920 RepID=A0ABU1PU75_9PSEU|nr:TetR/AcrR family transcriptional regulator [Saccharothrix longispora]MDR6594205.1 AcrR family transcriptional regulator [Saccharothrix longispora]
MSPRRSDPRARTALVDIAARLLAAEGPQALSTRRIAADAGSSTMAVYTHFGGMSGLVREMVHEGFARLQRYLTAVRETSDPVADMALLGRAYRINALENSHLYGVMFGGASLAGFSLTEEDRQYGRYTLSNVVACAARCVGAGRFGTADPELVAHQMWIATHGLVTLELGGYLTTTHDGPSLFESQLVALMVGVGDTPAAATRSVRSSKRRIAKELGGLAEAGAPGAPAETGSGAAEGTTASRARGVTAPAGLPGTPP